MSLVPPGRAGGASQRPQSRPYCTYGHSLRPWLAPPIAPWQRSVTVLKPPILAHLDLDAFFAAVEELENPELRRKPLVVGGDPRGRGVVATANYVARQFGIHSAMSCAEALRRCPNAVFVRPRHRTYSDYSKEVWSSGSPGGPDRRTDRSRRGLPGRRRGGRRLQRGPRSRRGGADGGARRYEPHLLPRCGDHQGGRESCERPAEAGRPRRRPPGQGGGVPRTVRDPPAAGRWAAVGGPPPRRRYRDHRRARRPLRRAR